MTVLNLADAFKVGSSDVDRIYAGANLVWEAGGGPGPGAGNLIIPAGKVASNLAGFPVRVDLSHFGSPWWADVTSDGGNIRVRQGGADLPIDLVWIDPPTETGELFFKTDLLAAADNTFSVEAVAGATTLAVTDPIGRNAVWSDYEAVVMFQGGLADRTGRNGTATLGGAATVTDGWLSVLDDGYALLSVSHHAAYTMGASCVPGPVVTGSGHDILLSYNNVAGGTPRHSLASRSGVQWAAWNGAWLDGSVMSREVRYRTHLRSSSGGRQIVVNGAQVATSAASIVPSAGTAFLIGSSETGNSEDWRGTISYVYLRGSLLTNDWLAAEFKSLETPSSFYTVA